MQKFLLAIGLGLLSVAANAQCSSNVNFNTWSQAGDPGSGTWSVLGGGSQAYQSQNASNPTFFISPFDMMNVHVTGTFRSDDSDNDWMGFVFSFLNPMGAGNTYDLWLFDWKKEQQAGASSGKSLCRVNGTIVIQPGVDPPTFWDHTNTPEFTVVQNDFGGPGWVQGTNHNFEMFLTYTTVKIKIDGVNTFAWTDCFKPGRFGFYNYSQAQCTYSNFQYDLYADFAYPTQLCKGASGAFNFVNPCVPVINQYASITWNFGDGSAPVVINNPTVATANVTHTYNTAGVFTASLTLVDNNGCSVTTNHTVDVRNPITLAPTLNQPPCNGGTNGSINLSPSGGFGNYRYSWNGGANTLQNYTGIGAGTYTVTVTDGICVTTAQYTLGQPTALSATTSHTDASCGANNGSVTINISGGTPPYNNVTWAGVAGATRNNLGAGTYIANFRDANNCSALLQYTETVGSLPCGITSSVTKTNATCFGWNNGSATLNVTGSTPTITVTWSNGAVCNAVPCTASNLPAGTYTYNYADGNASHAFNGSVTITQPGAAMVAQMTTVPISCAGTNNGQAVASVASGGVSPYNYNWSGGHPNNPVANNLSPGVINVTVTDSRGCTAIATGNVSGVPSLTATVATVMDSCYHSGKGSATVTASGGMPPYTYSWNNLYTDTANKSLNSGSYTVTVTDFNGCTVTASGTVGGPANPFLKTFTTHSISCRGGNDGYFNITTTGGTTPYVYTWNPNTLSGNNPTGLTAGIYNFTITDAYGCTTIGDDTLREPATALSAVSSHTDVTCNGASNGSITLTIGGGKPPYTYQGIPIPSGTNTLSNLAGGTYSGTVVDSNGCTATVNETIYEPPLFSVSETHTNVSCNGGSTGSITTSPTGGRLPYSFLWNDGNLNQNRTNIPAGNYSLVATDSSGCTATVSATISQPTAFSLSETHTNISCNGGTNGAIDVTPAGGTLNYTYLWNDGNTSEDRFNLAAGNYSVTGTDNNLCTFSLNVTITQPTILTATSSHTDVTCFGANNGTITVNVNGGTQPYSFLGNAVPAGTTTIPGLGPNTYSGNLTDANGCVVPLNETISQPPVFTVSETHTDVACNGGSSGSITITASGGRLPYSFLWNDGNLNQNRTNIPAGNYSLVATDNSGCTATVSATISQPTAFSLSETHTNISCNGGTNGTIDVTPAGGTLNYTYLWNDGNTNEDRSNLTAGNYSVTGTDNNLCTFSLSVTLTQPAVLTATSSHTDVTCYGANNGTITLNVGGGTSPYSFLGNPVPTGTSTISNLAPNTYSGNLTDANGCSVPLSETITEPLPQSVTVTETDEPCFGATQGTASANFVNPTGTVTYNWTGGLTGSNISNLAAGTYTVTATDQNNCSLTGSTTVNQPAAVVMTVTATDATCFGGNGSAIANPTGAGPFVYTWSGGGSGQTVSLPAGNYTVSAADPNTCQQTASFTINEPAAINVQDAVTNTKCSYTSDGGITLTVTGGAPGNYTYVWSPNVSSSNVASNLSAGNYLVTVGDVNSCTVSHSATVSSPTAIVPSLTATDAVCYGSSTGTITPTASGGTPAYSFAINSTSGNFYNLPAGTYQVTATDANLCTATASSTVNEPAPFIATVTPTDATCYEYTDGKILVSASGGTSPLTYSLSNGNQNSTGQFTGLAAGAYTATVTDANNCTASDSGTVDQPDSIIMTVTPPVVALNLGETIQLQTSTNQTGTVTYNWQPATGLSCYDCPNPTFSGNYSAIYTVTLTVNNTCSANATVNVTVIPSYNLFIPNAFTPNGDGTNDTWQIFGNLKGLKQIEVMVFNRWGEKVFETNDIYFQWDGRYKGESLPPAVYSFVGKFVWLNNHNDNNYKGTLTLLK